MGAGHSHALYVHEHSLLHRMAPESKIVAAIVVVTCVAVTPREQVWAFGIYAAVISVLVVVARIRWRFVGVRLLTVAPFVLFALLVPFVASGEQTEVLGVSVSVPGLWGAWNILVKALLGASVTIVLTATTEVPDLLRGLGVLRVPAVFTAIATFMVRYLELIADELGRMRVAMASRGYDPRWLTQARPIATAAGALFVRSYERGERVHAAMLSRGFSGDMPRLGHRPATRTEWAGVAALAVLCILVAASALVSA